MTDYKNHPPLGGVGGAEGKPDARDFNDLLRGYFTHPTIRPTAAHFVPNFGPYEDRGEAVAFTTTRRSSEAPSAGDIMQEMRAMAALMPPAEPSIGFSGISIGRRSVMPSGDLRIIEDPNMTDTVEDWSEVRSPSRAARRRKQGHRQRIRYVTKPKPQIYQVGSMLVMHPEKAREVRAKIAGVGDHMARSMERQMMSALLGLGPSVPSPTCFRSEGE